MASISVEFLSHRTWIEGLDDITWAIVTSPRVEETLLAFWMGTMRSVLYSPWSHLANKLDTSLVKLLHLPSSFPEIMDWRNMFSAPQGTSMTMKVLIAQSCLTHCDPMDCYPPGSSVHRILQAIILVWIFPTQVSNPGLPLCKQILHHLSYQEGPGAPQEASTQPDKWNAGNSIGQMTWFLSLTNEWHKKVLGFGSEGTALLRETYHVNIILLL